MSESPPSADLLQEEIEMRKRLLKKRRYIEFSPPKSATSSKRTKDDEFKDIIPLKKSYSSPRSRIQRSPHDYKKRLSFNEQVYHKVPMYNNHQLLGDSQFVRFSEQMLSMSGQVTKTNGSRCIGVCVSGQKIEDLRNRLESINYNVHSNVLVMIGTNDIMYRTSIEDMFESYNKLLKKLQEKCRKIVLLTVPPVPKFEKQHSHWQRLEALNKFVLDKADGRQIFAVDLCTVFISYNNTIDFDYFEQFYSPGNRPDLIHLNTKGFIMLKACLEAKYFRD